MNKAYKEGIIKEAGLAAFKILVTTFKACELKTHIEQMFIDDNTGEEFVLKFYSKEGFDRLLKANELSDLEYWKQRCKLSEKIEQESPCDPDITNGQIEAWNNYSEFMETHENPELIK